MDNYFIQAQKVRRLVQQDFNRVFALPNPLFDPDGPSVKTERVDVIICPTVPSAAPSLAEVETQDPVHSYMNDVFTVPASLAGLPSITLPTAAPYSEEKLGTSKAPAPFFNTIGLQIIGQYGDDQLVLNTAKTLEKITRTPQNRAGPEVNAWGSGVKSDTQKEQAEKLMDKFLEALGPQRLDAAAALCEMSRIAYVASFADEKDPLAAERKVFDAASYVRGT
jgi:aspartyl-tRNA(Asn)/glutamyl-tRNA(Gln) amidotransferase subunit A